MTAAAMRQRLGEFISTHARNTDDAAVEVDDHTREQPGSSLRLRPCPRLIRPSSVRRCFDDGTPPQDRVADIAEGSELRHLLQRGQYELARKVAQTLVDRDPANPTYLEHMATAELYGGHIAAAARTIDRLTDSNPTPPSKEG